MYAPLRTIFERNSACVYEVAVMKFLLDGLVVIRLAGLGIHAR